MRFHEFETRAECYRRLAKQSGVTNRLLTCITEDEAFGCEAYNGMNLPPEARLMTLLQLWGERQWTIGDRPFYNIWPSVIPILTKLDLAEVGSNLIRPPLKSLLLRFPDRKKTEEGLIFGLVTFLEPGPLLLFDENCLGPAKALFRKLGPEIVLSGHRGSVEELPDKLSVGKVAYPTLLVTTFSGPVSEKGGEYTKSSITLPLVPGKSLAEADLFEDVPISHPYLGEHLKTCAMVYATLCLLDQDSGLLDRVVLAKDRERFDRLDPEKDAEAIAAILRRADKGVLGWDVGRRLEAEIQRGEREHGPHFRRPHFAIRWMGKKPNLEPRIRPVRGTLVNREKVLQIPTGFAGAADD